MPSDGGAARESLAAAGIEVGHEPGGLAIRLSLGLGCFINVMLGFSALTFSGLTIALRAQDAPPAALAVSVGFVALALALLVYLGGATRTFVVDARGIESVTLLFGRPVSRAFYENGRIGEIAVVPRTTRYGTPLPPVVRFGYEGRPMRPQIGLALAPDAAAELVRLIEEALGREPVQSEIARG